MGEGKGQSRRGDAGGQLIVLVNVVLLITLKETPICWRIGPQPNLFVSKSGLCTPPKIFVSFASAPGGVNLCYDE